MMLVRQTTQVVTRLMGEGDISVLAIDLRRAKPIFRLADVCRILLGIFGRWASMMDEYSFHPLDIRQISDGELPDISWTTEYGFGLLATRKPMIKPQTTYKRIPMLFSVRGEVKKWQFWVTAIQTTLYLSCFPELFCFD